MGLLLLFHLSISSHLWLIRILFESHFKTAAGKCFVENRTQNIRGNEHYIHLRFHWRWERWWKNVDMKKVWSVGKEKRSRKRLSNETILHLSSVCKLWFHFMRATHTHESRHIDNTNEKLWQVSAFYCSVHIHRYTLLSHTVIQQRTHFSSSVHVFVKMAMRRTKKKKQYQHKNLYGFAYRWVK